MRSEPKAWLRASLQGTTLLGIALLVTVWGSLAFHLAVDRSTAVASASRHAENLARGLEEHVARAIHGQDSSLKVLRAMYERDPLRFNLVDWTKHAGLISDMVLAYAVIDADGRMVASSGGTALPDDVSDRDHFRFHADRGGDELFIGRTLVGPVSGEAALQLSRRLRRADGGFGGIIVVSLNPKILINVYEEIDLGPDSAVSVAGTDGHVRAMRGFKNPGITRLSSERGVLKRIEQAPAGTYVNDAQFDGVERLVSYRQVQGLPLLVVVAISTNELLARHYRERTKYAGFAAASSIITLLVMLLSARHRRGLNRATERLRRSEATAQAKSHELRTTLDHIDQGILMADAQGRIHVMNRRLAELLDLPAEWLDNKPDMNILSRYLIERGEYGNDGERVDARVWDDICKGGMNASFARFERTRPNGVVLEVNTTALPDGGLVRTFADITERKRAEAQIARLARHDELTGLANRAQFREQIGKALGRAQRFGEGFAMMLVDLDFFKVVNDSRGHPAGDQILSAVGRRLLACVQEHDTVARLGGDEFAVLQAQVRTEEDAARLAHRIIAAICAPFDLDGEAVRLGTSIGLALAPRDGADYAALVKRADQALYRAKEAGGNAFCVARSGAVMQVAPAMASASLPATS